MTKNIKGTKIIFYFIFELLIESSKSFFAYSLRIRNAYIIAPKRPDYFSQIKNIFLNLQ